MTFDFDHFPLFGISIDLFKSWAAAPKLSLSCREKFLWDSLIFNHSYLSFKYLESTLSFNDSLWIWTRIKNHFTKNQNPTAKWDNWHWTKGCDELTNSWMTFENRSFLILKTGCNGNAIINLAMLFVTASFRLLFHSLITEFNPNLRSNSFPPYHIQTSFITSLIFYWLRMRVGENMRAMLLIWYDIDKQRFKDFTFHSEHDQGYSNNYELDKTKHTCGEWSVGLLTSWLQAFSWAKLWNLYFCIFRSSNRRKRRRTSLSFLGYIGPHPM